jgi:hypothetical protein
MRILLLLLGIMGGCGSVGAQTVAAPRTHGPSAEVVDFQTSEKVELYRLRIVNRPGGEIAGSRDAGQTWTLLGHAVNAVAHVSQQGYTASKWAPMSAVAATAVNAIHLRTGYNAKDDKGVVFSLLPKELLTVAGEKLQSFLSKESSIYTDIAGGTAIFGGHWAPILGNPLFKDEAGTLTPLPTGYVPQAGDVFVIRVLQPRDWPRAIIFENRFGGFITLEGWDGRERVIGQVLKPVVGVGRFTGTQYADIGRLRANHNGVIDISVSRYGQIGGFQILPREHAMSPEMVRARSMTQWMVVGPLDARDPSWEGTAPLFRDYLLPSWVDADWESPDWKARVTSRVLIDVRLKDGPWTSMPRFAFDPDMAKPFPDWANTALQDVTHVRILLPVPKGE